ncbi:hypothetical protein [Alicyclobacillus sp. SO9]|uniref:hypothetical protein n=1 Tax=Alicyclobacillus sp. SO9 TaxID=2665646 RepID=UPI0018E77ED4|nr:hypothetical protein [Alicyclobacillus sp. SO9]QQE77437.1 hypothetical protein GI364_15970 [Alicyclobacillus sp. SO9]
MPVPEPNCDVNPRPDMYQLLLHMNHKLDKLAVTLQRTNAVLEKWPTAYNQGNVTLKNEKHGCAASAQTSSVSEDESEEPVMVTTPQGVTIVRM